MLTRFGTHIVIDINDNGKWNLEINGKKVEQNATHFAIDLKRYGREADEVPTYILEYSTVRVDNVGD